MAVRADLARLIEALKPVSARASAAIVDIYRQQFSVAEKHDQSPVTEADLASHDIILEGLQALLPGVPVLSEEDAAPPFAKRRLWSEYWLVDPLDGTREFIKGNDEFTINIALIVAGRPVLGFIEAPVTRAMYFAHHGSGAFKAEPDVAAHSITTRKWEGRHIVIAGSRSHRSKRFNAFADAFPSHEVVPLGSSLKSCLVAEGNADVYVRFGPTSEWDTAAAQCVLEEAGGGIYDLSLRPLAYNQKESLLNPPFLAVGDIDHPWREFIPPLK